MLIGSNNEAAESVARSDPSFDFIQAMNDAARELGMLHTAFQDSTGLSPLGVSTIDDLERMMIYVYESHPEFLAMSAVPSAVIEELGTGEDHEIQNINIFAGKPGFLGGKTGYTDESLGNIAGFFINRGTPILIILVGSSDRFKETQILYDLARQ